MIVVAPIVLIAIAIVVVAVGWAWRHGSLHLSEQERIDLVSERIVRRFDVRSP